MNRFSKFLEGLDEDELALIKKELETGIVAKQIDTRIKSKQEADPNKICPVCQSTITDDNITLIFGPKGLRKKASFCAVDCLEYFINRIKQEKRSKREG